VSVSGFRLLEVAAQAEALRLRREARRMLVMAVLAASAGLFALFALGLLHLAAWVWLAGKAGPAAAALWVMLADLVVAGILYVASRRREDPIATEALRIRRRALEEFSAGSALGDLVRLVRRNHPAHEIGGVLAESLVRAVTRR
jgi:hypothetical protein